MHITGALLSSWRYISWSWVNLFLEEVPRKVNKVETPDDSIYKRWWKNLSERSSGGKTKGNKSWFQLFVEALPEIFPFREISSLENMKMSLYGTSGTHKVWETSGNLCLVKNFFNESTEWDGSVTTYGTNFVTGDAMFLPQLHKSLKFIMKVSHFSSVCNLAGWLEHIYLRQQSGKIF